MIRKIIEHEGFAQILYFETEKEGTKFNNYFLALCQFVPAKQAFQETIVDSYRWKE